MTGKRSCSRPAALLLGIATAFATSVHAAGFALMEQSGSGLGNAFAGAAAAAEDASTVYWNPAGMSRLRAVRQAVVAGHAIMPSSRFSNSASVAGVNRTDFGSEGGDAGVLALIPNAYFTTQINSRWSAGLGINVPFGLSTEYDPAWVGRFQGIRSELETLNLNPSVAWKATDRLAIGAGINWQRGRIELLSGVNYKGLVTGSALDALVPVNAEGQSLVEVEGEAWGYNVGLMYDLTPATRIGLSYRSSIEYDMTGTVRFSAVPGALALSPALSAATANGNVTFAVKTPDSASVAISHQLDSRWQIVADVLWTGWDKVKSLPLVRDTGATLDTLRFNFHETLRYAVGANYRMNDALTLRLGLAFDETPVPNAQDRSVRLPDSDRTWFATGAKYRVSNAGAVDVGYTYIQGKDAPIDNNPSALRGRVNGNYKAHVNILSIQYTHSF